MGNGMHGNNKTRKGFGIACFMIACELNIVE